MKFFVINGSPRAQYSVTLQSILYLEALHKEHQFEIFNIKNNNNALLKNKDYVINAINNADCLIFSYPVYTFLAPSQLHYFIRELKELNLDLKNKFVSQITTSKHFYDYTSHQYILDNMLDLKLKYIKGISLDMDDLLTKDGRSNLEAYFDFLVYSVENNIYEKHKLLEPLKPEYIKANLNPIKLSQKKVTLVCDLAKNDLRLKEMIDDFIASFKYEVKLINLKDFPFKGGCLGCLNCVYTNKCVYNDGFKEFFYENFIKADAIVYAFKIVDHSMGALFKMFDDRQFINGHRTSLESKPIAYIIDGDLEANPNLKTVIEARSEVGHNYLAGIITSNEALATINKLSYAIDNKYSLPRNSLGVGGLKIFRDLVYLMQGLMKEDHRFYKAHGYYDFPQKKHLLKLKMIFVGYLMRNKRIRNKMGTRVNELMLEPYKKAISEVKL